MSEVNISPVLCIAAAGVGKRMAEYPIHKALLPINGKAIISHVIESFDPEVEVVMAVGHQKELLKSYLAAAYPDGMKKITFVDVENYDGPGSGPGHSMNCCREHLQRPFWFITCDCLVVPCDPYGSITSNWIGVQIIKDGFASYSTAAANEQRIVTAFANKSPNGHPYAYIGFCGIKDYKEFWQAFDSYLASRTDTECEHVGAFYRPELIPDLRVHGFNEFLDRWFDTGTPEGYENAKQNLRKQLAYSFEKNTDEITYQLNKWHDNYGRSHPVLVKLGPPERIARKVRRGKLLGDLVPECNQYGEQVYSYPWVPGKLLYEIDKAGVFMKFLRECAEKLWSQQLHPVNNFKESCRQFYQDKTMKRVKQFADGFPEALTKKWTVVVNGNRVVADMDSLLKKIDFDWLSNGVPAIIHGDLNFGNVVCRPDMKFKLIDWREDFADQEQGGDLYYDFAKLYAGADVSWHKISHDYYSCEVSGDTVTVTFQTTPDLQLFVELFEGWIAKQGYDVRKVKTLAALIYLNMSPLHEKKMGKFLFFLALERLANLYAPVY